MTNLEQRLVDLIRGNYVTSDSLSNLRRRVGDLERKQANIHKKDVTVGDSGDFKTIQRAIDSTNRGDGTSIVLLEDYNPMEESYPIRVELPEDDGGNVVQDRVTISPDVPHSVQIGHEDLTTRTLVAIGGGAGSYATPFEIRDIAVKGGGIDIMAWPFSTFDNIMFETTGRALAMLPHDRGGMYGTTVEDCQAWNCGDTAYYCHPKSNAHGTKFRGCSATAVDGIGFKIRGANISITESIIQLNYEEAIDSRGTMNFTVSDCYIEGNGRDSSFPLEVYIEESHGASFNENYFHGINPRTTRHGYDRVQRGINAVNCNSLKVENNTYRRYGEGFILTDGCKDVTADKSENYTTGDTKFMVS